MNKCAARGFSQRNWLRNTATISAALQVAVATPTLGSRKPLEVSAIVSADHPVNRLVPTEALGAGRRRSRERRMRPNVHRQEHHGNVIGRARAADISIAHRAGQRSMALEPARHVERSGSQLRILDLRRFARRTDQRFLWLSVATSRKHGRSGKR